MTVLSSPFVVVTDSEVVFAEVNTSVPQSDGLAEFDGDAGLQEATEPLSAGAHNKTTGHSDDGENDDVVICSSAPAFQKLPSKSPVKTVRNNKLNSSEPEMVIEDMFEPAPIRSLRRDQNHNHVDRKSEEPRMEANPLMALGVERNPPIIERLVLPPGASDSDSEEDGLPRAASDPGCSRPLPV